MHIMIDLETIGVNPTAPIITIGAVRFDKYGSQDSFYASVDLKSAVESGAIIEPDTVMWWLQQSEEARDALMLSAESITEVLEGFREWIDEQDVEGVWGNSSAFDNVILAQAYKRLGMEVPWHFSKDRCYRTVKTMVPYVQINRTGTHHNALDDAVAQVDHLIRINQACGTFL